MFRSIFDSFENFQIVSCAGEPKKLGWNPNSKKIVFFSDFRSILSLFSLPGIGFVRYGNPKLRHKPTNGLLEYCRTNIKDLWQLWTFLDFLWGVGLLTFSDFFRNWGSKIVIITCFWLFLAVFLILHCVGAFTRDPAPKHSVFGGLWKILLVINPCLLPFSFSCGRKCP